MLDQTLATSPPVSAPEKTGAVVETMGSMLFLSRQGFRRRIPMGSRVLRARRGLDRAVGKGLGFHLWMHVEDLVPDTALMLAGLDCVLAEARARADRGDLALRTMAELGAEPGAELAAGTAAP